jgi:hypothetical protein
MSDDEVMANIIYVAQNMEEYLPLSIHPAANPLAPAPPISAFVAVGRNSFEGATMLVAVVGVVAPCRTNAAVAVD